MADFNDIIARIDAYFDTTDRFYRAAASHGAEGGLSMDGGGKGVTFWGGRVNGVTARRAAELLIDAPEGRLAPAPESRGLDQW